MSRALMSSEPAPSDRTYSMTVCSAHWMARCRMVVSSRAPDWVVKEEVLMRGPLSALSRMALEMKAVSPLRRASTMRNFLTEDSSEAPLSVALRERPPAMEGVLEGVRPMRLPETDSLELWLLMGCWGAGLGDCSGVADVEAVTWVELPRPVGAASSADDMSSSTTFRLRSDKAEDLVRRCELRVGGDEGQQLAPIPK